MRIISITRNSNFQISDNVCMVRIVVGIVIVKDIGLKDNAYPFCLFGPHFFFSRCLDTQPHPPRYYPLGFPLNTRN